MQSKGKRKKGGLKVIGQPNPKGQPTRDCTGINAHVKASNGCKHHGIGRMVGRGAQCLLALSALYNEGTLEHIEWG